MISSPSVSPDRRAEIRRIGVFKPEGDLARNRKSFDAESEIDARAAKRPARIERQLLARDDLGRENVENPVGGEYVQHAARGVNAERLGLAQGQQTGDMIHVAIG